MCGSDLQNLQRERKEGNKRRENSSRWKNFSRERGKEREERRGERAPRDGKFSVTRGKEREGDREKSERGERKTFLLPPLLTMEAISVARRREERGEGIYPGRGKKTTRKRERRERERERERREERSPHASPRDGCNFFRERERGERVRVGECVREERRRGRVREREMEGREGLSSLFSATEFFFVAREREREREKGRGEARASPPNSPRDRNFFPSQERDIHGGRGRERKRARGREERREKNKGGERGFLSFFLYLRINALKMVLIYEKSRTLY